MMMTMMMIRARLGGVGGSCGESGQHTNSQGIELAVEDEIKVDLVHGGRVHRRFMRGTPSLYQDLT